MNKYKPIGIKAPGKVNLFLRGTSKTVNLFDLSQDDLQWLYENHCPYVTKTPEAYLVNNKPNASTTAKVIVTKTKRKKT